MVNAIILRNLECLRLYLLIDSFSGYLGKLLQNLYHKPICSTSQPVILRGHFRGTFFLKSSYGDPFSNRLTIFVLDSKSNFNRSNKALRTEYKTNF